VGPWRVGISAIGESAIEALDETTRWVQPDRLPPTGPRDERQNWYRALVGGRLLREPLRTAQDYLCSLPSRVASTP
jgi:hypothetical protein